MRDNNQGPGYSRHPSDYPSPLNSPEDNTSFREGCRENGINALPHAKSQEKLLLR